MTVRDIDRTLVSSEFSRLHLLACANDGDDNVDSTYLSVLPDITQFSPSLGRVSQWSLCHYSLVCPDYSQDEAKTIGVGVAIRSSSPSSVRVSAVVEMLFLRSSLADPLDSDRTLFGCPLLEQYFDPMFAQAGHQASKGIRHTLWAIRPRSRTPGDYISGCLHLGFEISLQFPPLASCQIQYSDSSIPIHPPHCSVARISAFTDRHWVHFVDRSRAMVVSD
jgi:hypothetical protein